MLGANKRMFIVYYRDGIRSGEFSGSAGLHKGLVELISRSKAYRASIQQDRKKLMLIILHEHHLSSTQELLYCLPCV